MNIYYYYYYYYYYIVIVIKVWMYNNDFFSNIGWHMNNIIKLELVLRREYAW